MISRRIFIASTAGLAVPGADFPVVDFHAHVEEPAEIDEAIRQAQANGVKLGVLWHAGKREYGYQHMLSTDAELRGFLEMLQEKPAFRGIQAEGLDWMDCFSKDMIARLDYVLTDALTFRERDGRMVKLWLKGVDVGEKQDFMDRYTDYHVEIMDREPIDILANPTFLPEYLMGDYDALWREGRMRKVIDAARKHGVAIEINSRYRLPREKFLKMAVDAGVKFSFGSNAHGLATGRLEYSLEMARQLRLEKKHLFEPAPRGRKPVERRRMG